MRTKPHFSLRCFQRDGFPVVWALEKRPRNWSRGYWTESSPWCSSSAEAIRYFLELHKS